MEEKNRNIFNLLMDTLHSNGVRIALDDFDCFSAIVARNEGKVFSDEEHLEGIIFSLLSSQRPWGPILANKQEIKNIFKDFDFQYILDKGPDYFEQEIRRIKCGNKSIHRQMNALPEIIAKLLFIKQTYGSLEAFVLSDMPLKIAKTISAGKEFKIPELGFALALEYLRNVGIDIPKPDTQLCRLFGQERLGFSQLSVATPDEVVHYVEQIAKANQRSQAEAGTLFWLLCAKDYGNICSQKPKCEQCHLAPLCNITSKSDAADYVLKNNLEVG